MSEKVLLSDGSHHQLLQIRFYFIIKDILFDKIYFNLNRGEYHFHLLPPSSSSPSLCAIWGSARTRRMWLCHSPPLFKLVLSPSKISPPSQSSLRPQSHHHNHGRDWPRSVIRIICKQIFIVRDHSLCKRPCMTENPYDLQIRYNHWPTLFSARGRVWKRIKIICKKKLLLMTVLFARMLRRNGTDHHSKIYVWLETALL